MYGFFFLKDRTVKQQERSYKRREKEGYVRIGLTGVKAEA